MEEQNWLKNFNLEKAIPDIQLGPPGIPAHLYFVGAHPGGSRDRDQEKLADQNPRVFEVTALLSRTVILPEQIDLDNSTARGGSYLRSIKGSLQFEISGQTFQIHTNQNGELAKIIMRNQARTLEEALFSFQDVFTPILDHLSFIGNVPIAIQKLVCIDIQNQIVCVDYYSPYKTVDLEILESGVPNVMLPILALYREAKISPSPFYRMFCYLKIMEGIFKDVRREVARIVKRERIEIKREKVVVPANEELASGVFSGYIGQPIQPLFETILQKQFRNSLAHFSLDKSLPWNLSSASIRLDVERHLNLAEICCRTLIDAELAVFKQIRNASPNPGA